MYRKFTETHSNKPTNQFIGVRKVNIALNMKSLSHPPPLPDYETYSVPNSTVDIVSEYQVIRLKKGQNEQSYRQIGDEIST